MKPLTKEEIEAYKKFSKLCKKLEQMKIKQAKVIKFNTNEKR
jgi:hypothetical protein